MTRSLSNGTMTITYRLGVLTMAHVTWPAWNECGGHLMKGSFLLRFVRGYTHDPKLDGPCALIRTVTNERMFTCAADLKSSLTKSR